MFYLKPVLNYTIVPLLIAARTFLRHVCMKTLISRILRLGGRLLLLLFLLIFLYLLAALVLTMVPVNNDFRPDPRGMEIYIYASAVHTDIILPARAPGLERLGLFPRNGDTGHYDYAGFGWGDRDFYLNTPRWNDLNPFTAIRSLFWPTGSVMHVSLYQGRLEENPALKSIHLNEQQYLKLLNFISRSFRRDASGNLLFLPGKGYTRQDMFFEAHGSYSLFYTCNNWTIEALATAGVKVPLWSPFAQSVTFHLK